MAAHRSNPVALRAEARLLTVAGVVLLSGGSGKAAGGGAGSETPGSGSTGSGSAQTPGSGSGSTGSGGSGSAAVEPGGGSGSEDPGSGSGSVADPGSGSGSATEPGGGSGSQTEPGGGSGSGQVIGGKIKVRITTTPAGAFVTFGDEIQPRGKTPIEFEVEAENAEATLLLDLPGYASEERTVKINANVDLEVALKKKGAARPGGGARSSGSDKVGDDPMDPFAPRRR